MKTREEKIKEFFNNLDTEVCVLDYIAPGAVFDFGDVWKQVQEGGGFDVEIIYHVRAMEYLTENDPSLYESFTLAEEMGYETRNLSSEILASLLASSKYQENLFECKLEIAEFFDNLD